MGSCNKASRLMISELKVLSAKHLYPSQTQMQGDPSENHQFRISIEDALPRTDTVWQPRGCE